MGMHCNFFSFSHIVSVPDRREKPTKVHGKNMMGLQDHGHKEIKGYHNEELINSVLTLFQENSQT